MKHHTKSVITALRLLCIALSVMLIVTMIPMSGFGRVHAEPKDYELQAAEEQAENAAPLQEENAAPLQEENAAPLRQAEDDQETDPDADQETGPDADQNRETEEAATLPNVKGAGDDDTDGTDDTDVTSDPFTEFWDEESGSYILESGTYTLAEDFVAQGYIYVPEGETVTIDLAGYALKRELESGVAKGYIIENAGTLTVQDSGSDASGKITGGNNGGTSRNGGGIYNLGTFYLEGGSITGNKARMFGGGIYNEARGTVNITGGSITNNTTQKGGGILNSGTMTISNAVISGNVATADRGGGIYNTSSNLSISGNTTIENNRITHPDAERQGGGIYTEGNITMSGTPVIRNNTPMDLFLAGNTVVKVGGTFGEGTSVGVSAENAFRKITSGFKTSGNSSDDVQSVFFAGEGYALKENGGEVYLIEVGEVINSWKALQDAVTEAPDNTRTVLTLSGDVTANSDQERIRILENKEIVLDLAGHKLNRNRSKSGADRYGQVIGVYGKLTIEDSSGNNSGQITGGNAERGGGINIDDNGECVLNGGSIIKNNVSGDGGGVYVWGTFRMSGGKVSENDASGSTSDGGGIAVNGDHHAVLDITGGEIRSNSVWAEDDEGRAGGAIAAWSGATVNISNAYIGSNRSRMEGGAIYTTASATISNCTFQGNSTQALGGTREPYGTIEPYSNYTIYRLNETYDGGAIYITGSAEVNIDHSTFDRNYVKNCELTVSDGDHGKGGAICVSGSGKLNISDSLFKDHVSWDGGAIYTNTDTNVSIKNTRFEKNHVGVTHAYSYQDAMPGTNTSVPSGGGGGITSYGTLTLEGCTFTGNYLTTDKDSAKGGAVYCKGKLTMNDVTCTGNKGRLGGAVYLGGGNATLDSCKITNNEAVITGGGVHVGSSSQFTIKGKTIIKDNFATNGYDVYLPSGKVITLTESLGYGADIGVVLENDYGRFTKDFSTYHSDAVPETYFYSSDGYEVYLKDNEGHLRHMPLDDEHQFIKWRDQIKTNTNRLNGPIWMAGISGERYLNEINIPCTHDSSMRNPADTGAILGHTGASFAQTQVEYIDQQLQDGIRCVDLRLIHEKPKINFELGWLAPWVGGTVAGPVVGIFGFLLGSAGIGIGAIVGVAAGLGWMYLNPEACTFTDDGKNLYTLHGKTGAGRYYALDEDGDYLSLAKELEWIKDFLKRHPTETVIVEVAAETTDSDDEKLVMKRLRTIVTNLSQEINPTTEESYVYWEKDESGSDKICEPFEHYPQLKDCRGKIVFGGARDYIGGFSKAMDDTTVYRPAGDFHDNASQKIEHLQQWFDSHHTLRIPEDATGERRKTVYSVGTNGTDEVALKTPVMISKVVLPAVFPGMIGESQRGQYLGFISMDGPRMNESHSVWITNFFSDLKYCTVTVEPGNGSFGSDRPETQTYQLLKGTKIRIPGCIYDGAQANKFKGWLASTNSQTYNLNDDYVITENVTFTAQWAGDVQTPVTVIWKDAGNLDGIRPQTLNVLYNGNTKTVTASENWTTTLSGELNGDPQPEALEGYEAEVTGGQGKTGYTITMTHTPKVGVNTSGKVTWEDRDDMDGIRPSSVTLRLFANGVEKESTTVAAENNWRYSFGEQPQYVDGEKVEYWIQEDEIPETEGVGGYSISIDGFNVTNIHDVETTVTACVIEWDDDYNSEGLRPDSVTIQWNLNGEPIGEPQVIKDNGDGEWIGTLEMTRGQMERLSRANEAVMQKYIDLAAQNDDGKLTEAQQEAMQEELRQISEITVTQNQIGNGYVTRITVEVAEIKTEDPEGENIQYGSTYFKIKNTLHIHKLNKTDAVRASCTEDGNTEYWTCEKCGLFFSDEQGEHEIMKDSWIIKATGHKLKKTAAVEPGCTTDGNTEYWTCENCHHYFGDADGKKEINKDSWIIKATGHDLKKIEAVDATCTKAGSKEHWICKNCGLYFSDENAETETDKDSVIIPATGHDWGDWEDVKASTCIAEGQRMRICRNDKKHIEYEKIALLNHALKNHAGVAATCTVNGNIEYWTCEKCGHYFSDKNGKIQITKADTVLKAPGHKWDAGKVTKEPTQKAPGIRTFTCTVCKATRTESIPAKSASKQNRVLAVKLKAKGKTSLVISWSKVDGADGYDIFFGRCNGKSSATMKKLRTCKGNAKLSWTVKGLKKHKGYKAYIKAWKMKGGKKTYIKTSLTFHAFASGGSKNYTNPKSVKVNKKKVTLNVGKTFRIKAKVKKRNKKKKLISKKHAPKLRYQSSDKKIATVSRSGRIKAKAKGSCTIYVYAASGVYKTVKVTVR